MQVYYWDDITEMFMMEVLDLDTGMTEGFCGARIKDWEDIEMDCIRLEHRYFRRAGRHGRLTILVPLS